MLRDKFEEEVSNLEEELQQIMIDRYIEEEELTKFYDDCRKKVVDGMTSSLARCLISEGVLREFEYIINGIFTRSSKKMKKQNEDGKESRNVVTKEVLDSNSLWEKIKQIFKDIYNIHISLIRINYRNFK